jgi:hypothetical protein
MTDMIVVTHQKDDFSLITKAVGVVEFDFKGGHRSLVVIWKAGPI